MRTEIPDTKAIIKPLQRVCQRGHDFPRVYSDWLALCCHSLTTNEPEYLELMGRYRDNHATPDRNADLFAEAFGAWLLAMKTDMQDYLGRIFEEHVSHGEKGQYFTPEPLCQLMAEITSPNLKDGERVHDPA